MHRPSIRRVPQPARIAAVETVTPSVRRLALAGDAVREIVESGAAASPTVWLKIYPFDRHGRAYTIRRYDDRLKTIAIDVLLHDGVNDESVAGWARSARAGEDILIGRIHRARFTLLRDSQWIWIAADASALPAAQTILRSLPASMNVRASLFVGAPDERQILETRAKLEDVWHFGSMIGAPPATLPAAIIAPTLGQAWIAGESDWVKRTRAAALVARILPLDRISSMGYWRAGVSGHREDERA